MSKLPPRVAEANEELARLREDLIAYYKPANSQERFAVERIALAQQSMLRAARLEASIFAEPPGVELHSVLETEAFKIYLRFQAQAERLYRRALEELQLLQSQRQPALSLPVPITSTRKPRPTLVASAAASSPPPPGPAAPPVVVNATLPCPAASLASRPGGIPGGC